MQDVITDKDFHLQCPLSRSNNGNKIKNEKRERERERKRERENISVGFEPGIFKRKRDHTTSLSYPPDTPFFVE